MHVRVNYDLSTVLGPRWHADTGEGVESQMETLGRLSFSYDRNGNMFENKKEMVKMKVARFSDTREVVRIQLRVSADAGAVDLAEKSMVFFSRNVSLKKIFF